MLRLLHFSDLHIGVENYGRTDPQTGLNTRLADFLAAYDELVDYAIANGVHLVLFAGDAYKGRDPSQTHQREFARRVLRLTQAGIPVVLCVGNHDMPHAPSRASALEIFGVLGVPGVTVGDTLATHRVETTAGPVQVVALPWVRRSALLTHEKAQGLTYDQLNDRINDILTHQIALRAAELDPALPAVLVGHVTLSSATFGSERGMMLGSDYRLLPSAVARPEFDYVALGHIHRRQRLGQSPPAVYSGSLARVDFSEAAEDAKGFMLIDLDPSKPRGERIADLRFQPVAHDRRMVVVEVEVGPQDDPTAKVAAAIRKAPVEGAIVKVIVRLAAEQAALLDDRAVYGALEPAHYVAAYIRDVRRESRVRLGGQITESLAPMEALRLYLDAKKKTPAEAERLLGYARALMAEDGAEAEGEDAPRLP